MVKEKIIRYIECDGCRKEIPEGKEGIVTFTSGAGERSYDLCCDCIKELEDMLNRKQRDKEVVETAPLKTIQKIKPVDTTAEVRKGMIKPVKTAIVDNIGKDFEDRLKEVKKRVQGLIDIGMSQAEIAREAKINQGRISCLLNGKNGSIGEDTLGKLEVYFYMMDNERKQEVK